MTVTLYGLKNCDSCKKAMKALSSADVAYAFVDIRSDADLPSKVPAWLKIVGSDALLNTRSTTWRGLSDADKGLAENDPVALLVEHPTLIKRPVVEANGSVHVGWTKGVADAVL